MAWKVFNIGKANARIEQLEAELSAITKERDDLKAGFDANASEITKQAEALTAQVTDLQGKLAQADADLSTAKASIAELTEKVAETEKSVEERASARALEISAAQGTAVPIKAIPADKSADAIRQEFQAMQPGPERTAFYRKHKNVLFQN